MKILITSAEVAPFAKAGGLADVIGALPKELLNQGVDARIIMPLYGGISKEQYNLEHVSFSELDINLGDTTKPTSLWKGHLPGSDVIVYFVENDEYFGNYSEVYPQNQHYRFEQERYILFCKSVLQSIKRIDFHPDVIHCNDWHTALIPTYLKTTYQDEFYSKISTLFSIHNLAYQGWYSPDILELAELPKELFNMEQLEFYGDVNWMKGGIYFADAINTVSEKYAQEIQTKEYGERLEGFLNLHKHKLEGILNGIDYDVWNPKTDNMLKKTFTPRSLKSKDKCKTNLQELFDLEANPNIPTIALISRLVDQKGMDLIAKLKKELGELPAQFIFLGTGTPKYEKLLRKLDEENSNIGTEIRFCINLSHNIYAGSDFFLMPSKFEPCGLGQLIAMKYGSLPIVRSTGGLADTVEDEVTGFAFGKYSSKQLLEAIQKAINTYYEKDNKGKLKKSSTFIKMQKTAMNIDFSWGQSAQKYIKLYNKIAKSE